MALSDLVVCIHTTKWELERKLEAQFNLCGAGSTEKPPIARCRQLCQRLKEEYAVMLQAILKIIYQTQFQLPIISQVLVLGPQNVPIGIFTLFLYENDPGFQLICYDCWNGNLLA